MLHIPWLYPFMFCLIKQGDDITLAYDPVWRTVRINILAQEGTYNSGRNALETCLVTCLQG